MEILLWIAFGVITGSFAQVVMPGPKSTGGIAGAIPLGIAGAIAGGVIGKLLPVPTPVGFDFHSLLTAVIGSLFVVFCYRCNALRSSF